MRRLLLEAVDVAERGENPRGLNPQSYRAVRPHDHIVPKGEDWRRVFEKELMAKW
jgi:hypothetical protein